MRSAARVAAQYRPRGDNGDISTRSRKPRRRSPTRLVPARITVSMITISQPMTNTGPFSRARCDISISVTAMMGTGLSATPTASGRICPIAVPIWSHCCLVSHHAAEAQV